ncbi:MAG: helix-turn-helix domain-containing protein [Myxococcota bacterium]
MSGAGFMSLRRAADRLDVSPRTVRRYVHTGLDGVRLHAWRLGKTWRTSEPELTKFIERVHRKRSVALSQTLQERSTEQAMAELERRGL